jgi:hypothetical protein
MSGENRRCLLRTGDIQRSGGVRKLSSVLQQMEKMKRSGRAF